MSDDRLGYDATITPERSVPQRPGTEETLVASSPSSMATGTSAGVALDALEQQELVSDIRRFRAMLTMALPLWWGFLVLDWLIVTYIEPGRLWYYALLRLIGFVPLGLATLRLWGRELPSYRLFRVIELATMAEAIAFIALMGIEYGGIASPYATGVLVVLVFRGAVLAAPWKRALLHLAAPAMAYPLVMLAAALWSSEIAAQFGESRQLAGFLQYQFFVISVVLITVWGSHTVWAFRRQAFENRSIGRYRLERRIGVGGMGEVWRAYDKTLKRQVALKLLRSENRSANGVARFEREAEATSLLSHPNTVRIFDYGVTDDGLWYYAMELLDGRDLAQIIHADGPLSPERALHLVRQAARALAEAHTRGIVHRDIKPDNLFVATLGGEPDVVKVLDFGIAKLAETETSVALTQGNWAGGTPAYMSPEAARGRAVDARSDVYALGAVLYFALTGAPPFGGDNVAALLDAHIRQFVVPPSAARGEPIPAALEQLVLRCLAKQPGERYADAGELARALDELSA